MRVKRYVVDSMPDALQMIRSELGKNAVILNTKEIRSGGFLGMFAKKKIEVIAAVESSVAAPATRPAAAIPPASRFQEQRTEVESAAAALRVPPPPVAPVSTVERSNEVRSTVASEPLAPSSAPSTANDPLPDPELLLEEMKKMKRLMQKIAGEPVEPELPPALSEWKNRLLSHEFETRLVDTVVEEAMREYGDEGELEADDAAALIRDQLRKIILRVPVHEIAEDTRVVRFVGPTGVGKTTTLAKLAALQTLKHHKNVAFVTADTYRIAAVEQLRTYANILNIPLEVVNSHQDLLRAYETFRDKDLIFMDTAGRNFRNEMYVSELNSLLGSTEKSETYLVLSLTMKYKDMLAVAQNFAQFGVDHVLFTKLDETDSYGPIFNLLYDTNFRPSYITDGQNVPEDIAKLNADKLIELIMGERTHD